VAKEIAEKEKKKGVKEPSATSRKVAPGPPGNASDPGFPQNHLPLVSARQDVRT
jgi:hypothetical protein